VAAGVVEPAGEAELEDGLELEDELELEPEPELGVGGGVDGVLEAPPLVSWRPRKATLAPAAAFWT
jgi:hypothetical protein